MKNYKALVPVIMVMSVLSSCVSLKKYNLAKNELFNAKQEIVLQNDTIRTLRTDLLDLFKVSGEEIDLSLFTSVQSVSYRLLQIEDQCDVSINSLHSNIVSEIISSFEEKPLLGTLRDDKLVNRTIRKLYFVASGRSEVLSSQTFYETVIYIVSIYASDDSKQISCTIDFVPLISASNRDSKQFLYSEAQINSYMTALRSSIARSGAIVIKEMPCLSLLLNYE